MDDLIVPFPKQQYVFYDTHGEEIDMKEEIEIK